MTSMRPRLLVSVSCTTIAIGLAIGLVVAAVGTLAVPAGASQRHGECSTSPRVVRDVSYDSVAGVDPNLLSLDLYLPAMKPSKDGTCAPVPLVVGVHGGGWRIGDKRGFTGDKAKLFNDQGWAFANVNYRLSDPAATPPVQYPTHNQDVANAVGYLVDHSKKYGLDPEQVGILGHSAGAGIVATVATDEQFLKKAGLGLDTLKCAFPDDTEGFDVAARIADGGMAARIYENAFGTDPAVWKEASPINHVERGKHIPPMLLTQRGEPGRVAQLQAFADELRGAGVPVTIIDASGYSHMQVNQLIGSTTDPLMTKPVTAFFDHCFAGSK
jgi:acetyl esterase/lipase